MGRALNDRTDDTAFAATPLAILFAGSGAAALALETAWARLGSQLFGASHEIVATLLAAFMLGLAIGSAIASRWQRSPTGSLQGYAGAEFIVAACAFASPYVFDGVGAMVVGRSTLVRVIACVVILLPPTIAMGVTLPLLTSATVADRRGIRRGVGTLYAANLLGGVLGAAGAGFVFLPLLGTRNTIRLAAALATVVGFTAFQHSLRTPAGASPPAKERSAPDVAPPPPPSSPWALPLLAVLGFVSFAAQVAWNRLFANLLGSSAYTFATVTSVTVLALGAGGLSARRSVLPDRVWTTVSRRALIVAIGAHLGLLVAHVAPYYLARAAIAPGTLRVLRPAIVACVVAIPAWQIGAAFPLLASCVPARVPGGAAGRANVAATVGNIAGALAVGFWWLPRWGVERTVDACAIAALLVACAASARGGFDSARRTAIVASIAVLLASVMQPRWDRVAQAAGTFRVASYRAITERFDAPCGPERRLSRGRVLFHREGALGTVVVLGHAGGEDCSLYSLRVNGKAEGSLFVGAPLRSRVPLGARWMSAGDLPTQTMAGVLPGLAVEPHGRALVVGWGTGLTVRALLTTAPREVIVAEIEPAVVDAAQLFDERTLHDPRVRLMREDGRIVLAATPAGSLDAIVSHPSNPWVTGAASLFSREYFTLARSRLRARGAMLAWVQLYETDREAVRSLVATFVTVFPDTHAFVLRESRDLLLIGRATDGVRAHATWLDELRDRAREVAADPMVVAAVGDLSAWLTRTPSVGGGRLARWAAGAVRNTDDNGWIEYRVASTMLSGRAQSVDRVIAGLVDVGGGYPGVNFLTF